MNTRSTPQTLAMLAGLVFLVVGILGFIPGITTNYDEMEFAGKDSGAELFGLFQVSILHNLVHILFGIAGLALARTWDGARTYLIGGGVIYLVLWLYGLFVSASDDANFIPANTADDWLHFAFGVALVTLGFLTTRTRPVTA
jgi:hypothetical protein